MSSTPKPGSGDAATDKTPNRTATGNSRVEPVPVNLTVNCLARTITVEPRMTLLDALREELALTGTKKACDRGECGACTVHIDGRRVLSCMTLRRCWKQEDHNDRRTGEEWHAPPAALAFIEHDGFQCGFCTSGQIISGVAMIEEATAGWPSAATADLERHFTLATCRAQKFASE